jgi:anti-anti-sigma factor
MENPSAIMINLPEIFGAREAKELGRELKKKINGKTPNVIVDLSRVKKMDSAGIEGLLSCMQHVASCDGSVQLAAISPEAATLLELARMDHLFFKFPSVPAQAPAYAITPSPVTETAQAEGSAQPQPVAA